MDNVKEWWRKQERDLGSVPEFDDGRAEKKRVMVCARPRYNDIYELFGGSAAYATVWAYSTLLSEHTNSRRITVCEVGDMYKMWKAITETDWEARWKEPPFTRDIKVGEELTDLFPDKEDEGIKLVMQKILARATAGFQKRVTQNGR